MTRWFRDHFSTALLATAVFGLLVVLGVEWAVLGNGRRMDAAPPKPTTSASLEKPPEQPETAEFALPGLPSYGQMSERPLFMEGRRPGDNSPVVEAPAAPATPLNMKLMGVVFTPTGKLALIVDSKGKYRRMRQRESHEGWTLMDLDSDKVFFQQGQEKKDLALLKPRPKLPGQPGGVPPGMAPQPAGRVPNPQPPGVPPLPDNGGQEDLDIPLEEDLDNSDAEMIPDSDT